MTATPGIDPLRRAATLGRAIAIGASAIAAAGLVIAPDRTWPSLLVAGFGLIGVALAGVFVVSLRRLANASWIGPLSSVPEAMAACLPYAAALVMAVLLATPSLYPVAHGEHGAGAMAFRDAWMARPFFLVRAAVYLLAWVTLARGVISAARRYDAAATDARATRFTRWSVLFIVVFAVTFSLASFDWIMALDPGWASTMFGIYSFAGLFASGLAVLAILAVWTERTGPLRGMLTADHLHDLGKLLFAFSTFWMYIWFSQFMLVWYANIPEEASYFVRRQHGAWGTLFLLNVLLSWIIPFLALLPRWTKRQAGTLVKISGVLLVGRWLDLYLMVFPPLFPAGPPFGLWETSSMIGAAGLLVWTFVVELRQWAPTGSQRQPSAAHSVHPQAAVAAGRQVRDPAS